jgi:hypothetical protein
VKKLAVLLIALLSVGGIANAISIDIGVGDRPYYIYGPGYWSGGVYYVWIPGHWAGPRHRVWIHGHYARR